MVNRSVTAVFLLLAWMYARMSLKSLKIRGQTEKRGLLPEMNFSDRSSLHDLFAYVIRSG